MIHFYHGLFGSPHDWTPIVNSNKTTFVHDLYKESTNDLLNLKTDKNDVLVGYSLGGRIALNIARRNNFNLSQIILMSAHPGLSNDEIQDRRVWEADVYSKMSSLSVDSFCQFWDSLEIFNSSKIDRNLDEKKLRTSADLFNEFRLSAMPYSPREFQIHRNKITWIVGFKDIKYRELIEQRVSNLGIDTYAVQADHRVLKAVEEIKEILKTKDII